MPKWQNINQNASYSRSLAYLVKDNRIKTRNFRCQLFKKPDIVDIKSFNLIFKTEEFRETCSDVDGTIENSYFLDNLGVVRRSYQFHSEIVGYIITERLDKP